MPDEISKKSLKVLDKKLAWLATYAEFDVNINSVIGSDARNPEGALVIARRAHFLGFTSTVGILHDHSGQLVPLSERQQKILDEIVAMAKGATSWDKCFQHNLARTLPNKWHCRAGSRYLYICEDGLVHYCSQQRGYPGIPLEQYTQEHLDREYKTIKPCAPFCTISCVHRVSMVDYLRENPLQALPQFLSNGMTVRVLMWLFVTGAQRQLFRRAALRVLRAR